MKRFIIQLFKVIIFSATGVFTAIFTLTIGLLLAILLVVAIAGTGSNAEPFSIDDRELVAGSEFAEGELLTIHINGLILGEPELVEDWLSGLAVGVTYGYEVKDQLIEAAEDNAIDGVMLQINSPGGTIFGSNAILDGVLEYKERTGKPVYAYVSGMSASGSYWAALGADQIIADIGTTIGSIGVIFGPFQYYDEVVAADGGAFVGGVVTENGIQTTYFTGGRSKDLGNPYRQLTQEEITTLQAMVNDTYDQFVQKVGEHRGIEPAVVRNQIGALVYSEQQAANLGLIDAIGNKQEAWDALANEAGLGDDYKITQIRLEPSIMTSLLGAMNGLSYRQATSQTVKTCGLSSVMLAYHGDIQGLCQ